MSRENKEEFVKAFSEFLVKANGCQTVNLDHLEYSKKKDDEYLLIFVGDGGHSMKKVNVTGDSHEGIARDFYKAMVNWQSIDYERSV